MAGPLYRQIADQLRRMIESGDLKAGTQVPAEDQLMEEYRASRNTVRGALKELRSARDFAREEWPPSGAVRLMS